MIGRERELELLLGFLAGLEGGSAGAVLIGGEAGIGKTRLLTSLIEFARERGVTVLRGAAHPLERTLPFGPLVEALDLRTSSGNTRRAAIGRLLMADDAIHPGMPSAGQLQLRAVELIIDLLEALSDEGPVLVALDDLHWAESSTLLAFRWMLRRLTEVPVLLVASMRPSPRDRDLMQLLDDALQSGVRLIELAPLDDEAVAALVQSQLGLPPGPALTRTVRRAGGNPLLVVELLRSLVAEEMLDLSGDSAGVSGSELPDSVRQLVLRRLGYLPEGTVAALRLASLLGDEFSLSDMATLTGRRATELVEDLGEAFRAGLLADHRGVLVFRHQLVRDAIYDDMPEAARVALHREAAGALAAAGAPLAQVASHLVLGAVPPDDEAAQSLRAAARAAAPRAPGVAVDLLRRAHELFGPDHPEQDGTLAELCESVLRMGQVAEAVAIAEEVLARPHDPGVDKPLRFGLIDALSIMNRGMELIDQTEAALNASPDMPLTDQAFLLAQSSFGRTFSGDLFGGESASRRALALAERANDTTMICWSLTTLAVTLKTQGRYPEALDATSRVVTEAFATGDHQARMRGPFFMHGMTLCDADRLDDAAAAFRKAADESEKLESWWLLPDIQLMATEVRLLQGEWEEAAPALEGGIEFAREHGNMITLPRFHAYLALIAAARGDVQTGQQALEPFIAALDSQHPYFGAEFVFYAASVLEEVAGRPAAALDLLHRFWDLESERDNRYGHRFIAPALARLAIALDLPELARAATEGAEHAAALADGVPSVQSAGLRCRGMLDGDAEKMLAAVELADVSGRVLERARTCEDAADVLAAVGAKADGRALLERALDHYEALGASWHVSRTRARLRELGGARGSRGSRQRAATGWQSLTKSEHAVVELVAEGLTTREIGKCLFISPHTVNSHLRHSFQKLDVTTRAALAAKASRAHAG